MSQAAQARAGAALRIRIGRLWIDAVTSAEALERIRLLVNAGKGGSVFTPNVDHVVSAQTDAALAAAYQRCSLAIPDGQPLVWASRLLRSPLPERVAGSDLFEPLVAMAARERWRVYLFGGAPSVAQTAAARLSKDPGLLIAGVDDAKLSRQAGPADRPVIDRIRAARPHLVLVGLGAPKQELFIDRAGAELAPAVCLGLGATLDFAAGALRRAPRWMRRAGLEWLFRLGQEPRRLARRYLWNDPKFAAIVLRMLMTPRRERVSEIAGATGALPRP